MESKVNLVVEVEGIDNATVKLERYAELLKEARLLAEELASTEFAIKLKETPQVVENNKGRLELSLQIDGTEFGRTTLQL
ncbi:hypothetical protein FDP56_08940 [Enterococcus casseliflavus]|uniref:hypothetical protein n=1 Tax=Enterococcus casseliflavus TaxID=37734 RepID=UPI00129CA44F|nr:hypothetical protein [Enterococcus casseliflavus]MRI70540.1 hypothetical protein [Enterococcus casseliflavus]